MSRLNNTIIYIVGILIFSLTACSTGPQKIRIGQDSCSFCKMSIADQRFGAEILTKKGKVYKFDDMHCLLGFLKTKTIPSTDIKTIYLVDFEVPHDFIETANAFLLKSIDLHSPMGGDIASFRDQKKMKEASEKFKGIALRWDALLKEN